jgi:hypothetical protein
MKTKNVLRDQQTYEHMMKAAVQVKNFALAERLLEQAESQEKYPPSPELYSILLGGAASSGADGTFHKVMKRLRASGQVLSFNTHVAILEALQTQSYSEAQLRAAGDELVASLRKMLPQPSESTGRHQGLARFATKTAQADLRLLKRDTSRLARAVYILVELDQISTAEKLVNIYIELFPQYKGDSGLPTDLASALMRGYLNHEKYEAVQRLWEQTWTTLLARATNSKSSELLAAFRYYIALPFSIFTMALKAQGHGAALKQWVDRIEAAGFRLTGEIWQSTTLALAELGEWEAAMHHCEQKLMPQWGGWHARKKLSLEERQKQTNPQQMVPPSATLILKLQKEWLKRRRLAAWSADISTNLKTIEQAHPKLHFAFISAEVTEMQVNWEAGQRFHINAKLRQMFNRYSVEELGMMRKYLGMRLLLMQAAANKAAANKAAEREQQSKNAYAAGDDIAVSEEVTAAIRGTTVTEGTPESEVAGVTHNRGEGTQKQLERQQNFQRLNAALGYNIWYRKHGVTKAGPPPADDGTALTQDEVAAMRPAGDDVASARPANKAGDFKAEGFQ